MRLPHAVVASAQVGLSYLIVAGFFGVIVGEGMKYLTPGTSDKIKDALTLVAAFWFMRQRTSTDSTPPETK